MCSVSPVDELHALGQTLVSNKYVYTNVQECNFNTYVSHSHNPQSDHHHSRLVET